MSRDEAAKGLLAGGGVTNAMAEFDDLANDEGLDRAAETYGVHELLELLLNQSKEMKKLDLQFSDVEVGIEVQGLLDKLNIPREKRVDVLKAMGTIVKNDRPKRFIETTMELAEHVDSGGISYRDAVPRYDENIKRIMEREEEERRKTREIAANEQAKTIRISKEQQAKVKRAEEEQEERLRKATKTEQEKLKKVTKAEQEKSERARSLAKAATRRTESIEKATEKRIAALEKTSEALDRASKSLDKTRSEEKDLLERAEEVTQIDGTFAKYGVLLPEKKAAVLKEVERLGGDPKAIVDLIEAHGGLQRAVNEIKRKIAAARKALRLIGRDTRKASRGFDKTQSRLEEVQQKLKHTRADVRKAKRSLRYLLKRTAQVEGAGASLKSLRNMEAERTKELEDLSEKLSKTLKKVAYVEKVSADIDGLKRARDSRKKALRRVDARLSIAKGELKATVAKIAKAHALGQSLDELESRRKELDKEVRSMTVERNTLQRKYADEKNEIEHRKETLLREIGEAAGQLDSLIEDVEKEISSLRPIADAYKFIAEGKGEPEVVVPLTKAFLDNLVKWEAGRPGFNPVRRTNISTGAHMILTGLEVP